LFKYDDGDCYSVTICGPDGCTLKDLNPPIRVWRKAFYPDHLVHTYDGMNSWVLPACDRWIVKHDGKDVCEFGGEVIVKTSMPLKGDFDG